MGVVRDITVEQLAQAVGGIDTSGLAKDTTLQATNTALGNINTTLGGITTNDPPTDTTQQSIATAISGLATALGSDKANISGDNIVDKTTFRSNIGIPLDYVTKSATITVPTSSSSYYNVCGGLALSKGFWLITYWAEFQESNTGTRIIVLSSSPNTNNDVTNCSRLTAQNNTTNFLTRFGSAVLFDGRATDYTIYLNACQNSGVSLSVRGSMRAVKLLG